MKLIYVSTLYLSAVAMLICFFYSRAKPRKNILEKSIRRLILCVTGAVVMNATAVLMPTRTSTLVFYGIYHCLIDAMIMSLICYVRLYTGINSKNVHKTKIMGIASLIDCCIIMSNPFTNIAYDCKWFPDIYGGFWQATDRKFLFLCHLVLQYTVIVVSIMTLIRKTAVMPTIYKMKYANIALIMGGVIFFHISFINLSFLFDYSLYFYVLMVFAVYYFSVRYVPSGLTEKLLFFTISNMQDGIICLDIDGKYVHSNKNANDYYDTFNNPQAIEQQASEMLENNVPADCSDCLWEVIRRYEGEMHHYTIQYKSIFDNARHYLGCFFIIHDHTEETNKLSAEKYRATHDLLTGMYNKEYFYENVRNELDKNSGKEYYIICSDVKNFKLVNDIFGVETGDNLLKKIAGIIAEISPEKCIYGRLYADRFAVFMEKRLFNEKDFLKCISKVGSIPENKAFKIHIHIGIYEVKDPSLRVSVMCDRANLAIKTIKDSYQNIVAYYDSHLREDFLNEQKVISEFEHALETRQFKAYVQPQITAGTRFIHGGEVLVRWIHPVDGMIPPFRFIEVFEQTGLISRLDSYMWELACIQLAKWKNSGIENYYLSVNISQKDFYLLDVYKTITGLVEKYNVCPECLHLEITETAVMNNPAVQLELISRLREYGFIIEIDDFGSGYSSLNTLKDLTADVLKIDMGFLKHTENREERSKIILAMIVSLAKSLNMEVITEGVETKEQVDFLVDFGCDVFQGYFFAKPMPIKEFEEEYLNTCVMTVTETESEIKEEVTVTD
ncbi:MAG: bifunctional diguanylate cyclase/phosphodiesterase [Ruminococcus sp.]|nr:bifunctional diguanylate cyclase/phosphodiesterase [Ruminococcus sp.]